MTDHERVLRTALEAGEDPHTAVARHFNVTRGAAKQMNYFLLYSTEFLASVRTPTQPDMKGQT